MQQKVILILEDSPEWLMLYKTVSESLDCLVFVAENGIAGLDLLQSIPMPDLILLDLDMPKMNGLEFFLKLQNIESHRHIKVILTSDRASAKDLADLLPINGHIPKSAPITELQNKIIKILNIGI